MFLILLFFFFKQKTAYEMRISDWSSDVCSSDLPLGHTIGDFNEQPDGTCSDAEEDDEGQLAQAEAGKGGERQLRLAHLLGQPAKRPRPALPPLPLVLSCPGFQCPREIGRASCRGRGFTYV